MPAEITVGGPYALHVSASASFSRRKAARHPPCFLRLPAPARGMGAERKQLSAKKALAFMFSSVPADVSQRRPMKSKARQPLQSVVKCCTEGLQWPVDKAVEDPGKWLKGVARWLETSEDTDPVRVFTLCCDDFRPRRLKAPLVLAWLTVQLLGLMFQVILWLEVGRNLEAFEDTLAQNCAPSLQQHGICLGPAWNLSYSGTLSFPPGESQGAKAMEVQVEAMPGWEVPKGCLVGVRLGEALKQRRLDGRSATSYVFPKLDAKRRFEAPRARIDIYRHVGSCSVEVDPSSLNTNEVNIPCSDPSLQSVQSVRLRITSQAAGSSSEEQRQRQQEQETKESALNYLAAHGIEQTLAESVRQMLKTRPEDPIGFLCGHLQSSSSKPKAPEWTEVASWSTALPSAAATEVERKLGKELIQLERDLAGQYLPLPSSRSWPLMPEGMPVSWSEKLRKEGLLFEASEPSGRGVFVSHGEDFALWLNNASHVTLLVRPWNAAEAERLAQVLKQKLGA
eukprot:s9256_g2.t2